MLPMPREEPVSQPSDTIRLRLVRELKQLGIGWKDLCARLTAHTGQTWYPNRLSKLLGGHQKDVIFRVDDLVSICAVTGISLVEMVRDETCELVADLTVDELFIVQTLRSQSPEWTALVRQMLTMSGSPESGGFPLRPVRAHLVPRK